ncbi:MAG TPA: MerR family transcriptional regulator [Actinocrinis sp.]|jgi:DNA-binding transcriptional MerR regulator|uniref:MerR family transcriptional regulator n=1 Tax=Actinocrinis sp. TaxID=1920516 RepID=UPI002D4CDFAE|nr:MerR family transcriptional regulator [Actinocrinis sp.]HZU55779.1 MerR family transcriptional regulator [Actinocrinis sp.]
MTTTLTISQLADYVGVTVRAVRHYHQCGLLPEPDRDASGYRRYDAQAVIDLIRIKTLADAGVPLARVEELLGAQPEQFAKAVAEIDAALAQRIRELKRHRQRIAELAGGERLFLPDGVVEYLDEMRAMGVSERGVRAERDGWIMLNARMPEAVPLLIAHKRTYVADPEFRHFCLAYDQAFDWDPDDPRLEALADEMLDYIERKAPRESGVQGWDSFAENVADGAQELDGSMMMQITDASPAWKRLNRLAVERMRARTGDKPSHAWPFEKG